MIDNLSKDNASIITGTKERKILSIYLSNDKGDRTTGQSKYVTFELGHLFGPCCSPFYYNMTTFQNEWAAQYIVKATFHVMSERKDNLISFEKDCIKNRICPDTEKFNARGSFSGQYQNPMTKEDELITLQYAAYEPRHLKEDNAKNPLVIWLHGQGEGGTDIDIALLGNKVTALADTKIQSYFTTENGSDGAYVLAIQCKTYWMDGGDGENSNGDIESRYSEPLIDAIKEYLSMNTDLDLNRIYIGGCSNGGFMAMNIIISYPHYWAASYLICEGYPFMAFKRDENGKYIRDESVNLPTNVIQSDLRYFTDDKIEAIKEIPLWFVQSEDDPLIVKNYFSLPSYKELLKKCHKNCWYSYFKSVEGTDIPGLKYFGHWSWIRLFDDQVTTVQDREKILNSNDIQNYGFVSSDQGGGCQDAADEKGTYKSIWAWMNAQVKSH